jgi:hypothetical protein
MRSVAKASLALLALAHLAGIAFARPKPPPNQQTPATTAARLREKDWWPTRTDSARKDFVGDAACAACHKQKVLEQEQTSMAHAASRASDTDLLRSQPNISQVEPPFQTVITRDRNGSTYTVARGGEAMSGQLIWTMGNGTMGRTFVLQSGGEIFESQLSYFTAISALDLSPGHLPAGPRDIERAFGAKQSPETAQLCFGCHTTASSVSRQFDPAHATPGITCEACHGPGAEHVKTMQANPAEQRETKIFDPGELSPLELVDYCGACHRAPLDVAAAKDYVPINVRFQPYRLSKSRCWTRPDPRLTCTACHDPHLQLERNTASYDARCLACHATKAATPVSQSLPVTGKQPACPVSATHCVSCHMPKYKVPQMHGAFTDHDIRIVRPGDPYPL